MDCAQANEFIILKWISMGLFQNSNKNKQKLSKHTTPNPKPQFFCKGTLKNPRLYKSDHGMQRKKISEYFISQKCFGLVKTS